MLCALIMAGGKGTRFWPLSTEEKPKQFLKLIGEDTMIQMTVKRIQKLIPMERIFIVTAEQYVDLVKEQLPELPSLNIIVEPVGKNTAPCIALSAFYIKRLYDNASIAVLPSDHLIRDEASFLDILKASDKFIEGNNEAIVTIGMKPDRPETGYGYIKCSKNISISNRIDIISVERFVEKPNLIKAQEYIKCGNYLWNGGMFIWKVNNILKLTEKYLNKSFKLLAEIADCRDEDYNRVLEKNYKEVENVSVDYGIMEKAKNIYVIPSDFGWDDVGNWSSIERYNEKDTEGNVKSDNSFSYKSRRNIVLTKKKILLNNVEDLIVVETDDYIMISAKESEQEIKVAKEIIS